MAKWSGFKHAEQPGSEWPSGLDKSRILSMSTCINGIRYSLNSIFNSYNGLLSCLIHTLTPASLP